MGDSSLITEKRFASSHHDFWHDLLPMGEHYIRTANLNFTRYCSPLAAISPPLNGVISELAFRLFVYSITHSVALENISSSIVTAEADNAVTFIRRFRQYGRTPVRPPQALEANEALQLARRVQFFFSTRAAGPLTCKPAFQGCGWLNECEGDVLGGNTLYEIKAADRLFRMLDVRQLLTYSALNYAAKKYEIDAISLVNPREGIYVTENLNALCQAVAGRSSIEVLGEIIEYISDTSENDGGA